MAMPVYPSDLTDAEWALLAALLPPAKAGGRPRSVWKGPISVALTWRWGSSWETNWTMEFTRSEYARAA